MKTKPPVVIGIDPGLTRSAVGIAVVDLLDLELMEQHEQKVWPGCEPFEVLVPFVRKMLGQWSRWRPNSIVAVEDAYLGKNAKTFGDLSELRGAIIGEADRRGYEVRRVPAASWQADIGLKPGSKREEIKKWSEKMARSVIAGTCWTPVGPNFCDALHIARYAGKQARWARKIEAQKERARA